MSKLWICRGNIASGKTTWTKQMVEEKGWVRVNRDDIRKMIHSGKWTSKKEKLTIAVRDAMIVAALQKGKIVVSDDTNLSDKVVEHLSNLWDTTVEINDSFLQVPLEESIKRDRARENPVGDSVAIKMWEENFELFKKAQNIKVPEYDEIKRDCSIYDLDGTLFLSPTGTHWYERDFENDLVVEPVAEMIKLFSKNYFPIFLSGRQDKFREGTEEALSKLGWKPELNCHLFMRKTGDQRDDTIVKEELFWEHVYPLFNVKFVVDDRPKVIRMWRHKLRFFVFDVNSRGDEF